jgi:hypothetical protein
MDDGGVPPLDNLPPPPPPPPPPPIDGGGGDFDSGDGAGLEGQSDPGVPPGPAANPNSIEFDGGSGVGDGPSYSGRDLDIDGNVETNLPGIVKGNATQDEEKGPPVTPTEVKKLQKAMDEKSFPKGGLKAVAKEAPPERRIFGSYRLHVGVAKPTFSDIEKYEDFYGETRFMPTIGVDYYFWDWFTTFGLMFRMGYYKDDGYAASGKVRDGSNSEIVQDREAPIELTVIPLQAGITFQATPFPAKWLVLSGWFGAEAVYYQEYRVTKSASTSKTTESTSTSTAFFMADEAATDEDEDETTTTAKSFVSSGWRKGTTLGVSLSFLLNGFDQKTVKSLRTMNMSGVYLSPYIEVTQNITNDPQQDLSFSRMVMGAAFTFETY